MIHLTVFDIGLVLAYFAGVVFIGFRASRKCSAASDEYLLAGRSLTLPVFVATLVSTWYGGILGVGEFSYRFGLSNWFVFGLPYYLFALVFAFLLAKRIRATNLATIPDQLEAAYDRQTAILGGGLTFLLVSPAAYVLMLGILVQLMFGIPLIWGIVLTTFVTVVYLFFGGFRSDVWANVFEFVMMFLGFVLMLVFAVSTFGGIGYLQQHLPPLHLTWHGGNSWHFIAIWFFIALWTLVDPAFHQRCYAAKDTATARRGILVSIAFWFCFDFLTTTVGLYARAALPQIQNPTFSYPLLAELTLPPVIKGLFYIGMLATIMSTLSSLMLIAGITIGKDIVGRMGGITNDENSIRRWSNIGMILAAVLSIGLATAIPSVVGLWYTVGTCVVPALLIPILASYIPSCSMSATGAKGAMIAGLCLSGGSFLSGQFFAGAGGPAYWGGIEPMYPGLAGALLVWCIDRIAQRGRRKGLPPASCVPPPGPQRAVGTSRTTSSGVPFPQ